MKDPLEGIPARLHAQIRSIWTTEVTGGRARSRDGDGCGRSGQRRISQLLQATGIAASDPRHQAVMEHGRGLYYDEPRKVVPVATDSACAGTSPAVREGHAESVAYLGHRAFREVVALFDAHPTIGGTYFRPTNRGLQPVDLDARSKRPLLGIGDPISAHTPPSAVRTTMERRVAQLLRKRAKVPASPEKQLEARIIRYALGHGLRMPGMPERLRFILSQWRFAGLELGERPLPDLLAVDLNTCALVVIELKTSGDVVEPTQAPAYVAYLKRKPEQADFFQEVAAAMAALYRCPELRRFQLARGRVFALEAWPDESGDGALVVEGLAGLDHDHEPSPDEPPPDDAGARRERGLDSPKQAMFMREMRSHQDRYRAETLRVPFGRGPGPNGSLQGSMLRPPAASRGLNFLTPSIHEVALQRMAEGPGVERFRCLHNMLSSQPMCFNLFGPLVADRDLAVRVVRALLDDEGIVTVTSVQIEWAPDPVREYLGDGTSFDALIAFERADGSRGFVGIETKLTEPFSQAEYALEPRYRRVLESVDTWRHDRWKDFSDPRWNQLWRDHLLVEAVRIHPQRPFGDQGRLLLVRHPGDATCANSVTEYIQTLASTQTFLDMPLDRLASLVEPALRGEHERAWLQRFRARYML